jgi:hypothetical protein
MNRERRDPMTTTPTPNRDEKLADLTIRLQVLRYRRSADQRQRALIDLRIEAYDRQIAELEIERSVMVGEEGAAK